MSSENTYTIYLIENKINGKLYVGFTGRNPEYRFKEHIYGAAKTKGKRSNPFYKAINKYGPENFEMSIIYQSDDFDHCLLMETHFISEYHTWLDDPLCNGYNTTTGGVQAKRSAETIEHHRRLMTGKPKPEGFGEKISKATSGENNGMYGVHGEDHPFYGRKHTEESKKLCAKGGKTTAAKIKSGELPNPLHTTEAIAKMAATQKAKGERGELWVQSPEGRASAAKCMLGKKQTENQKEKARQANLGSYLIEKEDGEQFIIKGLQDFVDSIGVTKVQFHYTIKTKEFKNGYRLLESLGKLHKKK